MVRGLAQPNLEQNHGKAGLDPDKVHRRYYFQPPELGKPLEITYVPLNQAKATRQVVWQPVTKKTGLPKRFWYHRAVSLRFLRVAKRAWCLTLRPEMRVTRDGQSPLESETIGRRVTKKKSRMFNFDMLQEVQFWRDFLFESRPRLIASFGGTQALVLASRLMHTSVTWPGVPPERAESFKNVSYDETLFDLADLDRIGDENNDDASEVDWEVEDGE